MPDRYLIDLPDDATSAAIGAVAQALQVMEARLGLVALDNLVLGMQSALGNVAGFHMGGMRQETLDELLGLTAIALIYIKALTVPQPETEDDESEDRPQSTPDGPRPY